MLTKIYSGTTELADGTTALCGAVRLPGTNAVQTYVPVRGVGPVNIDRIGKSYEVTFTIVKLHASALAAALFRAQHNEALPNVADLVIKHTSGASIVTIRITDAAWQSVDPELIGISTRTTYRVTGGPLVITESGDVLEAQTGATLETQAGDDLEP